MSVQRTEAAAGDVDRRSFRLFRRFLGHFELILVLVTSYPIKSREQRQLPMIWIVALSLFHLLSEILGSFCVDFGSLEQSPN